MLSNDCKKFTQSTLSKRFEVAVGLSEERIFFDMALLGTIPNGQNMNVA
jgi:hypothetical protein